MTNWDQGYCPTCGAGLIPDASFCGNCGTSFTSSGRSWPGQDDPRNAPRAGLHDPYSGWYEPEAHDRSPGPEPVEWNDDRDGDGRRSIGLLVLAGSLILAVSFLSPGLMSGQDDGDGTDDLDGAVPATGQTDGQVLLQPADEVPDGAFLGAPGLDTARADDPDVPQDDVLHHVITLPELESVQSATSASLSGATLTGTAPGAYAGHRRVTVCDRSILKDAVAAGDGGEAGGNGADGEDGDDSPDAGLRTGTDVYADLLGLDSADGINSFLDGLTPLRLRFDTRVTQHTLADGDDPTPVQTILQAGTGVLVDADGTPRVSCNGANPLAAPDPVPDGVDEETALDADTWAVNAGQSWERFDPGRVVTITGSDGGDGESDDILFTDIVTTDLIERPPGTNGRRDLGPGDITAVLQWDSPADLDLAVLDPNQALVSTELPAPENSRGRHAEDANRMCEENMAGEERVSWPDGDAPPGEYTIRATGHAVGEGPADNEDMRYEADCGGDSADYRLTVRLYGRDRVVEEGSVADGVTDEYTVVLGDAPTGDGGSGSGEDSGEDSGENETDGAGDEGSGEGS